MPEVKVWSPLRSCRSCTSNGDVSASRVVQVVFRQAADAVRWCVAVQMQLMLHDWSMSATGQCAEDVGLVTVPEAQAECPLPAAMRGLAEKKCPHGVRLHCPACLLEPFEFEILNVQAWEVFVGAAVALS